MDRRLHKQKDVAEAIMHGLFFNLSAFPLSQRPLGPYRMAHYMREQGWDIEVVEYALHWPIDELKEFVRSRVTTDTKFFGLSHLFYAWSTDFEEFCGWVKIEYPSIVIISGSSANPGFDSKHIDYYIRGYGEIAMLELLKYIDGNGPCPSFNPRFFGSKKVIDAIHSYPAYPMRSLMVQYEDRDFIQPNEWLGIEFSRGCKFQCAFCNYPILGVKGDYSRDADDARMQMQDAYDRFGVTNYVIADDTFNDRSEKITKFADAVDLLNFDPYFVSFIRADLLATRPDDIHELNRMGVKGHYYGVESFNHASSKAIGKGLDPNRIKQALLDTKAIIGKDYRATIGLIVGLPEETEETISKTRQWLIENWQEQNFIAWGLEIYNPDGIENLSKISMDYKSYGYEYVDSKQPKLSTDKYDPMGERFIWKNKHMDFYQAQRIADDLNKLHNIYDFRATPFDLHTLQLANPEITLESILQTHAKKLRDHSFVNQRMFVDNYIKKKLNLSC